MSLTFDQLIARLHNQHTRRRIAVACPHDEHTCHVIRRSLNEGIADFSLVTDKNMATKPKRYAGNIPDK